MAHIERVTNDRTHTRTTSRRRNVALTRLIDEVPADQKVIRKAQFVDHAKFTIKPRLNHFGEASVLIQHSFNVLVAISEPQFAKLTQPSFGSHAFWQIEDRKITFAERQVDINRVGDLLRTSNRVFHADKVRVHLFWLAKIELVDIHLHSVLVRAESARVDTQHHILSRSVLPVDVVAVGRRDNRQTNSLRDFDSAFELLALNFESIVHDFDEVSFAEQVPKPLSDFDRIFQMLFSAVAAIIQNCFAEFARHTTTEANDSFAVSL